MKKILNFIKKHWFLFLLILTSAFYFVNLSIKGPPETNPNVSQAPIVKVATFGTLTPGSSTANDVAKVLGSPIDTKTTDGTTTNQYKSTNQYRFHVVTFANGVAILIKKVVNSGDNITSDPIRSTYGVAPNLLYNKLNNNPFNLFVYPAAGIAYLGHEDGTMLEIWYFQPTTIDDFIKNWGSGFSKTPPNNDAF